MTHHPAAFINAISEEGTKAEAVSFLQEIWNDYCDLQEALIRLKFVDQRQLKFIKDNMRSPYNDS